MKHLSNDHEDCFNQHKNSHNLYNEMGDPLFSLRESQWKLRQHLYQFANGGKAILELLALEERKKSKRAGL